MAKKTRTYESDYGFKGIVEELKKLEKRPYVKIGYPAEHKKKDANKIKRAGQSEDGTELFKESDLVTVLDVAIWSEFGTVNLPERSFIRSSFDQNVRKYENMTKKLLEKIYSNKMSVRRALAILGELILNDIKNYLTSGEVTPASKRAIKEGGNTLVDTAQLLNSLTYVVVMDGRKK